MQQRRKIKCRKIADDGDDLFFTTEIFLLFLSSYSGYKHTSDDDQHFLFWSDGSVHGQGSFEHCFIVRKSLAYFSNDQEDNNDYWFESLNGNATKWERIPSKFYDTNTQLIPKIVLFLYSQKQK